MGNGAEWLPSSLVAVALWEEGVSRSGAVGAPDSLSLLCRESPCNNVPGHGLRGSFLVQVLRNLRYWEVSSISIKMLLSLCPAPHGNPWQSLRGGDPEGR